MKKWKKPLFFNDTLCLRVAGRYPKMASPKHSDTTLSLKIIGKSRRDTTTKSYYLLKEETL